MRNDLKVRPFPGLSDITDTLSQLEEVLPKDHQDIINLTNAADMLTGGQFSADRQVSQMPEPLSVLEDPYAIDPHEEAEQFFNQQMQLLEKSFDQPVLEPTEIEIPGRFEEETIESMMMMSSEPFMEEQTLEEIVQQENPFEAPALEFMEQGMVPNEMLPDMGMPSAMPEPAEYDIGMVADEINQAIDQAAEPDPFQQLYDPLIAQQYMFDPMMQYMPNYMMPGPMLLGPNMGPMPGPQMM